MTRLRALSIALGCALGAGLLVAVPATIVDWRRNPAQLFRDDQGTNWPVVVETAFSWFWPVAAVVFVTALIAALWASRGAGRPRD